MSVGERFLQAIAARDFETVAACFTPDVRMRVLTPTRLRELTGPGEATERIQHWFQGLESFALVEAETQQVADRVRIRWHTRGRDPDRGWQENDHTGYAEIADDRIKALNVSCAGFRPVPDPADRG